MFGFCSLLQPKQCVLCASCHPVLLPAASEPPKLLQTPPPALRGVRLPLTSLFLRFFLLDNIDIMSGAHEWLHMLPLRTPGELELVRGQAGFATELLAEDDPSPSGDAGIAATSPRKCSSSHGSLGKAHSHLLLQHRPFPCSPSLSMSVNTTQSSLLGCCGCSVSGRDVFGAWLDSFGVAVGLCASVSLWMIIDRCWLRIRALQTCTPGSQIHPG